MAGYIGSKAVLLSTTAAEVSGDADIGGSLLVDTIKGDNGTTAMTIDSSGHVTMPKQSAFLVTKSASQDFDRNVDTTITFDTEVFDNNADFSSNTFTAAVTGKYQFNAHVRIDLVDNGAEYYLLYIRTSNRDHYKLLSTDDFSSDPAFWTWSSSFLRTWMQVTLHIFKLNSMVAVPTTVT